MTSNLKILFLSSNPKRTESTLKAIGPLGHSLLGIWTNKPEVDWVDVEIPSSLKLVTLPKGLKAAEWLARLKDLSPDLILATGLNMILPPSVLEFPKLGVINLHAGRLPSYKGGSPLNWQIINGEKEIGVSLIRLTADGIDDGPIVNEGRFPLGDDDDIASVHAKANSLFGLLVRQMLLDFNKSGQITAREATTENACYWHQRSDRDGAIPWAQMTAQEVFNFVRALTRPYSGAHAQVDGHAVRIFKVEVPSELIRGTPGRIVFLSGQGPFVVCKDRAIRILEYQTSSGETLKAGQFFA